MAAVARKILTRSMATYESIGKALCRQVDAQGMKPQDLEDFHNSKIIEAVRAAMNQEAILFALHASAQAESVSHGKLGAMAAELLSTSFDSNGADMIGDSHVICDLTPLDLSLGVYPIGPLALAVYIKNHATSTRTGLT